MIRTKHVVSRVPSERGATRDHVSDYVSDFFLIHSPARKKAMKTFPPKTFFFFLCFFFHLQKKKKFAMAKLNVSFCAVCVCFSFVHLPDDTLNPQTRVFDHRSENTV